MADDAALGTGPLSLSSGSIFASGGDRSIANAAAIANNATIAFIGEYGLSFSSPFNFAAAANNVALTNSLVAGKNVVIPGGTANAMTANRTLTFSGAGETEITGDITTSTAFGLNVTKTGTGTLLLGGTGASTFNQNGANVDVDQGTLRLTASEVIPHLPVNGAITASGALILSPELAAAETATFDLNGFNETVNGLTSTIDNSAATAAMLTFGANDATVNFGTGTGTYAITDSGSGALSITKTGAGVATVGGGAGTTSLTYQGTTGVTGGTLTVNAQLDGTTGLSSSGTGSVLNVNRAVLAPTAITSVTVGGGAALNLVNGSADALTSLTVLDLGAGAGTSILGLELGASTSTSDRIVLAGTATVASAIQFNITALAGFGSSPTYDLITATGGLGGGTYSLGNMPGGFTYALNTSGTLVQLLLTAAGAGDFYWHGDVDGSWSSSAGGNTNFSSDLGGITDAGAVPGTLNTVIFSSAAATGPAITTTLDNNVFINALRFTDQPAGVTSVGIAPGTLPGNTLTLAPAASTDGIDVADNAGAVTISAPVALGTNQTWNVVGTGVNGSSLVVSGAVSGTADLTKTGTGVLTLSADNPGYSGITTISAGALNIGSGGYGHHRHRRCRQQRRSCLQPDWHLHRAKPDLRCRSTHQKRSGCHDAQQRHQHLRWPHHP